MTDRVEISDVPDEGRFRIRVDGTDVGGAYYRRRAEAVVFTHTEIDDAYSGRGFGGRLAAAALDELRRRGEKAVVLCPFIAGYIRRHDEYADLVDREATRRLRRSR